MTLDQEKLRSFIRDLAFLEDGEPRDDDLLFSSGIVDSVSLIDLVEFVEREAGFKVSPAELTLEAWDSISQIIAFVDHKI
jgi:acyl carrier protein